MCCCLNVQLQGQRVKCTEIPSHTVPLILSQKTVGLWSLTWLSLHRFLKVCYIYISFISAWKFVIYTRNNVSCNIKWPVYAKISHCIVFLQLQKPVCPKLSVDNIITPKLFFINKVILIAIKIVTICYNTTG